MRSAELGWIRPLKPQAKCGLRLQMEVPSPSLRTASTDMRALTQIFGLLEIDMASKMAKGGIMMHNEAEMKKSVGGSATREERNASKKISSIAIPMLGEGENRLSFMSSNGSTCQSPKIQYPPSCSESLPSKSVPCFDAISTISPSLQSTHNEKDKLVISKESKCQCSDAHPQLKRKFPSKNVSENNSNYSSAFSSLGDYKNFGSFHQEYKTLGDKVFSAQSEDDSSRNGVTKERGVLEFDKEENLTKAQQPPSMPNTFSNNSNFSPTITPKENTERIDKFVSEQSNQNFMSCIDNSNSMSIPMNMTGSRSSPAPNLSEERQRFQFQGGGDKDFNSFNVAQFPYNNVTFSERAEISLDASTLRQCIPKEDRVNEKQCFPTTKIFDPPTGKIRDKTLIEGSVTNEGKIDEDCCPPANVDQDKYERKTSYQSYQDLKTMTAATKESSHKNQRSMFPFPSSQAAEKIVINSSDIEKSHDRRECCFLVADAAFPQDIECSYTPSGQHIESCTAKYIFGTPQTPGPSAAAPLEARVIAPRDHERVTTTVVHPESTSPHITFHMVQSAAKGHPSHQPPAPTDAQQSTIAYPHDIVGKLSPSGHHLHSCTARYVFVGPDANVVGQPGANSQGTYVVLPLLRASPAGGQRPGGATSAARVHIQLQPQKVTQATQN
ncbi:High-molecular-weight cytochrome c [Frankliniella fusca]|uniref:High-molecular-weight cytochrome c n=1 Tax=Frankliniella fusca TaxID=407009 RepID=A0AAE1LLR0_9NEOP|nr:High-molecular-weight cytochrome c [Frankliniella fusca]